MNAQWLATIFAWLPTALLILLGVTRWAAIAAMIASAVTAAVLVTVGIVTAVRRLRRAGGLHRRIVEEEAPRADFAFLANCLWCADLSEDPADCACTAGCTEVEWCAARYDSTNTSIGAIPVYREDGHG